MISQFFQIVAQEAQKFNETETVQIPQSAMVNDGVDETTLLIASDDSVTSVTETAQDGTIWLFVRMVLVLILVIGAIYGVFSLLKRSMNPPLQQDAYLRTVAQVSLGTGKNAQVITVGEQAFLIGVSDNNVSLIAEITDKELIDAMNINAEKAPYATARDFSSLLTKFFPLKSQMVDEKEINTYFPAAEETQEYLRRRRSEIQNGSAQSREEGYETPLQ